MTNIESQIHGKAICHMKILQATVLSLLLQANDEVRLGLNKNQGHFIISRSISYQIPGPNM